MTEYNLSFFEAMEALTDGKVIENTYTNKYQIVDGEFYHIDIRFKEKSRATIKVAEFVECKWRIVEPEKCWIDTTLKSRGDLDPCYKVGFQDGAKELAREAIRRIAIDYPSHGGTTGAAQILQGLIGEAE